MSDPNIHLLESVADALDSLIHEFVLVGGCAVGLLITDTGRPPVRQTVDVDLITTVTPLSNYYLLRKRLRACGFTEDSELTCRWKRNGVKIDVMPTDERVLGFTNSWYEEAARSSVQFKLPSGRVIRLIDAPIFVASKLEAFAQRGHGDYLHHDLEDIVTVLDGRASIAHEILNSPQNVKDFVREEFETLLQDHVFSDRLGWLLQDEHERTEIVLHRMRLICGL